MPIDTSMYGQQQPGSPVGQMMDLHNAAQNPINVLLQRLFGNGTGVGLQQLLTLLHMGSTGPQPQTGGLVPPVATPAPAPTNPLLGGMRPRMRPGLYGVQAPNVEPEIRE